MLETNKDTINATKSVLNHKINTFFKLEDYWYKIIFATLTQSNYETGTTKITKYGRISWNRYR